MEKTKLICCDIDDTLLAKDKSLPEVNCQAIRKVVLEEKIPFVIVSGRNVPSVKDFMNQIGIKGVVPSLGGCYIEDWDGNPIEEHNIDKVVALEIFELAKAMDCIIFAYDRKDWFVEPGHDAWTNYEAYALRIPAVITNIPNLFKTLNPNKVLGVSSETEKVKALMEEVNKRYNGIVKAFLSSPNYLEIVPYGINKGTAIDVLCRYYGIKKDNVMVIGDYYNDIDMFKVAGISVAVNNAPEDIKALATYVTDADCTHGAVAEAIQRFVVR